jgi:hypothetical protein
MRMSIRYLSALGLGLGLGGCAGDVKLEPHHVDPVSRWSLVGNHDCVVPPIALSDTRSYQGLGWIGGDELTYPELRSWIENTLRTAAQSDADAAPLQVELARAYMESHPSGHSFQMVLRVREQGRDERPWRIYRGNHSAVTWWGNRGEFGSYVEDAGREAIAALVKTEGRCSKRRRG